MEEENGERILLSSPEKEEQKLHNLHKMIKAKGATLLVQPKMKFQSRKPWKGVGHSSRKIPVTTTLERLCKIRIPCSVSW